MASYACNRHHVAHTQPLQAAWTNIEVDPIVSILSSDPTDWSTSLTEMNYTTTTTDRCKQSKCQWTLDSGGSGTVSSSSKTEKLIQLSYQFGIPKFQKINILIEGFTQSVHKILQGLGMAQRPWPNTGREKRRTPENQV